MDSSDEFLGYIGTRLILPVSGHCKEGGEERDGRKERGKVKI